MPVPDRTTALSFVTDLDTQTVLGLGEDAQRWLLTDGLRIVATVVIALVARWALNRLVNRTVARMTARSTERAQETDAKGNILGTSTGLSGERHRARVQTVGSLMRSVGTIVIGVVAGLTIMQLVGISIAPVLASAGVGGVAIGFGAQSLVKDFLSGIFMIFEDQYGVGDVVDTGEAIGTIEEVTLRITRLRDFDGVVWYVRNGEIVRIGNRSQGYGAAWLELPVSYREDISKVLDVVRDVCEQFGTDPEWEPKLIEAPTVLGVDSISGQTVTIKVLAKCLAGEQFGVQRELRAGPRRRSTPRASRARRCRPSPGPRREPVRGGRGRTDLRAPRARVLRGRRRRRAAAGALPGRRPRPGRAAAADVPHPVLRWPDDVQRGARPPPAADAARALPGDPRHARPLDAAHAARRRGRRDPRAAGRADARLLPAGGAHARQHRRR